MNRLSLFNSPFLLGFDQFERTIDRISKLSSDAYPPYNIEQISENILRITIAVAGFKKTELNINLEGNQLIIRGSKNDNDNEKIFIHRGIATRQFQRRFIIAEGIEVIVIDNLSTGKKENINPKAIFHEMSLIDLDENSFIGRDIDVVFHFAALARVQPSIQDPITFNKQNVEGTLKLLFACHKAGVKRVVYSGSSSC